MSSKQRLVAVLAVVASIAPTSHAAAQTLKLATLIPPGSFWDHALRDMGAEWEATTGGQVKLRIYGGGVAGDDPDMIRKMRIGQLQAATVTVSGLTEVDPAFAIFEVPMFFASYEELFHVLAELEPELDRRLLAKGFRRLHWVHGGWIHLFASEEARSVDQLRELRVFVWAGSDRMSRLWRRHGFRPVVLAATDILTGLETGLFQILPTTPIVALSLQWFRSVPYMIDPPLAPLIGATLVDERAWQRLPNEHRNALKSTAASTGVMFAERIEDEESKAIAEMRRRGLEVLGIVGSDQASEWDSVSQAFAESMREAFVPAEIYDRAVAARSAYRRSE